MKRILHVVGARPNFMKIAPIMREMRKFPDEFKQMLVHTGQHYDVSMSQVFFDELELPQPDINLEVGSGSHAWQTAQVMLRFEKVVLDYQPDWVILPGDVNSTLASALVCSKLGVKFAHVEAGLRSFDHTMPEEINRILTDHMADLLFTTEPSANENLRGEGISDEKIYFVGNVMIDTLIDLLPKAEARWPQLQKRFDLGQYVLVTLHRPSNVDDPQTLVDIMNALSEISERISVLFPVHPRTHQKLSACNKVFNSENFRLIDPLSYLDFLALEAHATLLLTDSGGIQEEATYLGIPCLTVRPNTERPITLERGINRLVSNRREDMVRNIYMKLSGDRLMNHQPPDLWDGQTAARIVQSIRQFLRINRNKLLSER